MTKEPEPFSIPDELYEKQDTLESKQTWDKLLKDATMSKLTAKEVIVLRIYFTFLNQKGTST